MSPLCPGLEMKLRGRCSGNAQGQNHGRAADLESPWAQSVKPPGRARGREVGLVWIRALSLAGCAAMLLTASLANALPDPPKDGKKSAEPIRNETATTQPQPRLRLVGGDFITGEIRDSDKPGIFRVQGPKFLTSLNFPVGAVEKLEFPLADKQMKASGEYCFELAGGDLIFGKLVQLSGTDAEIDTEMFGKLHVQTSLLRRIERWDGADELVYMGPNGLTDWEKVSEITGREEGDVIVLDQDGAAMHGNVSLPPKAVIELELAWSRKPNFTLSLGVDRSESSVAQAFGLEVWDEELVARRETLREADIATVSQLSFGAGGTRLMIFLDQVQGRMQVLTPSGKQLADLRVPEKNPRPLSGLRLTNKRGEIRLERLRITRWRDAPSGEVQTEKSRVHRTDNSIVYGKIESFDSANGKVVVKGEKESVTIDTSKVASLYLPGAETPRPDGVRLAYRNGTRITGSLQQIRDGKITLKSTGIKEEFLAPLAFMRSIAVTQQDRANFNPAGKFATLLSDGIRLRGSLVPHSASNPQEAPFAWQAITTTDPALMPRTFTGRIDFGKGGTTPAPIPPANVKLGGRQAPQQHADVWDLFQAGPPPRNGAPGQTNLHLRTGDTIPCKVVKIDEQGVFIDSTVTKTKLVPHDRIKAVELVPGARMPRAQVNQPQEEGNDPWGGRRRMVGQPQPSTTPKLDVVKRDRLLTLPRLQKFNPPTHLIAAQNGDLLRGRIVSLNEKDLNIELRLEPRKVPRDRLAMIVWLHPEETEPAPNAAATEKAAEKKKPGAETDGKAAVDANEAPAEKAAPDANKPAEPKAPAVEKLPVVKAAPGPIVPEQGVRVHVVRIDRTRLTFNATKLANERLSGDNEILGPCDAPLNDMNELLLGTEIETAASRLAYHLWRLKHALDPLPDPDEGESGGTNRTGLESKLIGQEAPDFELDLHGGKRFKLSSKRGSVVVLDFWASWCGPCMNALPQVHAAAEKLKAHGVVLVAVNIEETPEQVAGALKRLGVPATVAMDTDGKVGGKYGVQGIPRTIIIDRQGKIARDYTGASAEFEKEIQDALEVVLGIAKPAEKKPNDKPTTEKPEVKQGDVKPDAKIEIKGQGNAAVKPNGLSIEVKSEVKIEVKKP